MKHTEHNIRLVQVAMRKAMPNAVFFAFSGTPIDKKNGNYYKVLGLYLINILLILEPNRDSK